MERIENNSWQPAQPESRALVAIDSGAAEPKFAVAHSSAAFLTQLLAIKAGVPQTRERRREEPEVAAHFYEAQMIAPVPNAGGALRRAL